MDDVTDWLVALERRDLRLRLLRESENSFIQSTQPFPTVRKEPRPKKFLAPILGRWLFCQLRGCLPSFPSTGVRRFIQWHYWFPRWARNLKGALPSGCPFIKIKNLARWHGSVLTILKIREKEYKAIHNIEHTLSATWFLKVRRHYSIVLHSNRPADSCRVTLPGRLKKLAGTLVPGKAAVLPLVWFYQVYTDAQLGEYQIS